MKQAKYAAGALDGLVLISYSHSYGRSDGLSRHLALLNRELLRRNRMTIYQIHPERKAGDHAACASSQVGCGDFVQLSIPWVRTAQEEQSIHDDQRIRTRLKLKLIQKVGIGEQIIRRFVDIIHSRSLIRLTRYLPLFGRDIRQSLWIGEQIEIALDRIQAAHRGAKILYIDHSPWQPLAWLRLNLVRRKKIGISIEHHGGFNAEIRRRLFRISRGVSVGAVTLHDSAGAFDAPATLLGSGIDLDFLDRGKAEAGAFRRKCGIAAGTPLILVPARVTFDKGQHDLVTAFDILARRYGWLGADIVFAGDIVSPYYQQELKAMIARLAFPAAFRFHFAGALDRHDLRNAYCDADLMLSASHFEGLPRVVLEAQALGVPMIATRAGGTADGVIDGVTGVLVDPRDSEGLAFQINEALRSSATVGQQSDIARRFMEDCFGMAALAARHEDFYNRSLPKRGI